jgi:hypothetical protein
MKHMGQDFMPINKTKREYFTAKEIGGGAKLWEWCANREAGVLPYLLRKSDDIGGGDIADPSKVKYAGRWAGDEVYFVGDYDSDQLWEHAKRTYANIAQELVDEYNQFIEIEEGKLKHSPEMTQPKATAQNVTLYPKQRQTVQRLAVMGLETTAFNGNFSLALRFIIDDWERRQQHDADKKNTANP